MKNISYVPFTKGFRMGIFGKYLVYTKAKFPVINSNSKLTRAEKDLISFVKLEQITILARPFKISLG